MSHDRPTRSGNVEDFSISALMQSLSDSKKLLITMAKQLVDTSLLLGMPLEDERTKLRDQMLKLITFENKVRLQREIVHNLKDAAEEFGNRHEESTEPLLGLLQQFESELEEEYDLQMNEDAFDNLTDDPDYSNLMDILGGDGEEEEARQEVDGDIEMVETQFQIPRDPYSRQPIEDPVRNKTCKHIYERETFHSMFNPTRRVIKCPVRGCPNKQVTVGDIEADIQTKALIEEAKAQKD